MAVAPACGILLGLDEERGLEKPASTNDGGLPGSDSSEGATNGELDASATVVVDSALSDVATSRPDNESCPDVALVINCSDTCDQPDGSSPRCERMRCDTGDNGRSVVSATPPLALRTPAGTLATPACSMVCPEGLEVAYTLRFAFQPVAETPSPYGYRARVNSPWYLVTPLPGWSAGCVVDDAGPDEPGGARRRCAYLGHGIRDLVVRTDEPDPPSRNVIIEAAPSDVDPCADVD